jgi:hypothetical protein
MKVWKVRSRGILERIIIYLGVGIVVYTFLEVRGLLQGDDLILTLVFFSIMRIPVVLVIFKRLISSKFIQVTYFNYENYRNNLVF